MSMPTDLENRLSRFVQNHDRAALTLGRRLDHVDLRYANGFAVRDSDTVGVRRAPSPSESLLPPVSGARPVLRRSVS